MYKNKTVIQIGSHVGKSQNDPIFNYIDESTKLILVEPVPYLFNKLKDNYSKKLKNLDNVTFINKAVSNFIGELELTIPSEDNDYSKLPWWASQLSSVNKDHATNHIKELKVETIKVQTTTLNQIIEEYNITNIFLLHTDTEGHDKDIIENYNFNIKPTEILFENKHMDGYKKKGKKFHEFMAFLKSHGYILKNQNREDTRVKLVE